MNRKAVGSGLLASVLLLGIYFAVVTLVSGWDFARTQFITYWYFILSLAVGFGIQAGLYTHLKSIVHGAGQAGKVVAVSGTTSTAAMVACCAHYLTNILPILGATGALALVAQYQVGLFWVGLAFNVAGVVFIGRRVMKASGLA